IQQALPIFHEYGIYPSANLGINRNLAGNPFAQIAHSKAFYDECRSGFEHFFGFICDLGFTMVNCCYPMSVPEAASESGLVPVYAATATDSVVNFSQTEKKWLFKALFETIPLYRSRIRIFTPRTALLALIRLIGGDRHEPYSCRGGVDFFFIDAKTAHTYPCGYRGADDLGRFEDLNLNETGKTPCHCLRCDWECFRDPSELMGPVLHGLSHPAAGIKRWAEDRIHFRLWREDLRYYRACRFFDGRKAPEWHRMRGFEKTVSLLAAFPHDRAFSP
ncbi:MAG: radical SAM protein, partial [Desulfatirhabdiaceae bacterium]